MENSTIIGSVIIPTYNGAEKLPFILNSLLQQIVDGFEVIIVVDGSTDNTLDILNNYNNSIPNFNVIVQKNQGRAVVRNTGAKAAKSDLLLFFDDDVILDPNCLEEHFKHHQKFPNSILTGGLRDSVSDGKSDFLYFRKYLGEKWTVDLIKNSGKQMTEANYFVMAANLSVSKEVFFKLGGFDENLTDAEDLDFGVKAWLSNVPMYFSNNASGIHFDHPTTKQYLKRLQQYRLAKESLIRLKPQIYSKDKALTPSPSGIKKVFFSTFRNDWWVESIDNGTWKWMPIKLRYKLYDYIITANSIY